MFSRYLLVCNGGNRVVKTLRTLDNRADSLISLVRWRRPPWAPLRASKLFRVRVKPVVEPEEAQFMKRTNDDYKATMRSLRSFIQEELEAKAMIQTSKEHIDFEEDFKLAIRENTLFNKKSAELRSAREVEENKIKEEQELNLMLEIEKQKQEQIESARHEVLKVIDKSSEFVSEENLDTAIEEALNTRKLYNFAIDTKGQRYVEQEDGSTVVVDEKEESSAKSETERALPS